jgi:acyl-CoA synthetase (AMP-forming)/AMP-acid ligase II
MIREIAVGPAFNSVYEIFCKTAERLPENPFFCAPAREGRDYYPQGVEFSYSEILSQAEVLKERYAAAGYGYGHRVACLLENRPEIFHHFLALNALGISLVPVNPDYRHDEMRYQLEHSDAVLVISISDRVADCEAAAAETPDKPLVLDCYHLPAEFPTAPAPANSGSPGPDTEAAMLYTSGTTGRPKGCILSNLYFAETAVAYTSLQGEAKMYPDCERIYNPLPLFHMNALAVTAVGLMLIGGCLVSPDRFHPGSWWQDLRETRATVFHYLGVVPPMLLNAPTHPDDARHNVRFGFGAGVDPKHHGVFEERFGMALTEGWGMTEVGRLFSDSTEPRCVGTRAFGKETAAMQARIVDENDIDVPPDANGEMIIRHSAENPRYGFFSGYYKDEAATEEAWRGGWFHTGDTVRMGEDGMMYFVDRSKNIIRRAGENIAAAEVEAVLQDNVQVAQAAVLAAPDELREEEVYACIVPMPGVVSDEAFAQSLFEWCQERLSYFKTPGYVLFLDKLPTTGTQKIQKGQIFDTDTEITTVPGVHDFRSRKKRG